jgi:hypothetical protein
MGETGSSGPGAREKQAERVFQAVVYAYEGREVPADLLTHGMVRRGLKFRAAQEAECAALRVKLAVLAADLRARTWLSPLSAAELNHRDEFLASTIEAMLTSADAKEGR